MKRKWLSLTARQAWEGRLFVLPLYLGFFFFFLRPMGQSLIFAFFDVKIAIGHYDMTFVGLGNFRYILFEENAFITNLIRSSIGMLWRVPSILVASLFLALVLNSRFRGRMLVRAIFFLPVIIASGVIIGTIKTDIVVSSIMSGNVVNTTSIYQADAVQEIMTRSGFPKQVIEFFTLISSNIFDVLWQTGIQTTIFLAGLQSIPASMYEASAIEGATAWESFWKITLPMLKPVMLVNVVYTMVDWFTSVDNVAMRQVLSSIELLQLDWAAAMSWLYFVLIGAILLIVFRFFSRTRVEARE